ncbi:MAG: DUF393 domain-containing protein [Flavobacteriaceae bacterium]|nr:DUF393 domain-containing protein [Flavobacteriaceae bacterium]
MNINKELDQKRLILYDGSCGVCNVFVDFLLKTNINKDIRFLSLESDMASDILEHYKQNMSIDAIIYIVNGIVYQKSTAALEITKNLRTPYIYMQYLKFIPLPIRDFLYDIVAKNRYRLKKHNNCRILTKEEKKYFW